MANVNKNNIEKIFNKVHENFIELNYNEKYELLNSLERKTKTYNGENISEIKAITIAFEKIKYHFSRIYTEGKAKSGIINLKKYIDFVDGVHGYLTIFNDVKETKECMIVKDLITYLEISLNLDVTFYTSLLNIYHDSLEKNNLSFNHVLESSERRKNR